MPWETHGSNGDRTAEIYAARSTAAPRSRWTAGALSGAAPKPLHLPAMCRAAPAAQAVARRCRCSTLPSRPDRAVMFRGAQRGRTTTEIAPCLVPVGAPSCSPPSASACGGGGRAAAVQASSGWRAAALPPFTLTMILRRGRVLMGGYRQGCILLGGPWRSPWDTSWPPSPDPAAIPPSPWLRSAAVTSHLRAAGRRHLPAVRATRDRRGCASGTYLGGALWRRCSRRDRHGWRATHSASGWAAWSNPAQTSFTPASLSRLVTKKKPAWYPVLLTIAHVLHDVVFWSTGEAC
jgi:hypothetical protein